jgi:predicted alpha/beta hydrolase family esterase
MVSQPVAQEPLILIVPESPPSGRDDWQTRWQRKRPNCRRLELGMWDAPHRNTWINKLNLALARAGRPVLLVGHGLGCLAVAWWAEYEQPRFGEPVFGALLVAPPDLDIPGKDHRVARFGACPRQPLPFRSFLVASRNDPKCTFRTAISLARDWDCRFADAGAVGHIDAESEVEDWPLGERLLDQLLREHGQADEPSSAQHLLKIALGAPFEDPPKRRPGGLPRDIH